jgi:putative membrane protein
MKKLIVLTTILILLFIPLSSAFAYSQNKVYDSETVYVLGDSYGNLNEKILVDWIRFQGNGKYEVKDPIKNLVNIRKIYGDGDVEVKDGYVIVKGESKDQEDTYYRGDYNGNLPFEIKVKYFLNGKEEKINDIKGKSGRLRIEINGKSKLMKDGKVVPLLMIGTTSLDVKKVKDLKLSGDTKPMILGTKYQINLTIILDSEGSGFIEFESDSIDIPELTFTITPYYFGIELPSMDIFDKIYGGLDGLTNLVKIQKNVLDGIIKNSEGNLTSIDLSKLQEGIENLKTIAVGIDAYKDSILMLSNSIDEEKIKALKLIPSNLDLVIQSLQTSNTNLSNLIQVFDVYINILKNIENINKLNQEISNNIDSQYKYELLKNLKNEEVLINSLLYGGSSSNNETILSLSQTKEALLKIKDGNDAIINSLVKFKDNLNSLSQIGDSLSELKRNLSVLANGGEINGNKIYGLSYLSNTLKDGLNNISVGIAHLNDALKGALSELINSLKVISSGGKVMNKDLPGLSSTVDNLSKLKEGVNLAKTEYNKNRNEILEKKKLADSIDTFIGKPENAEGRIQFIVKLSQ